MTYVLHANHPLEGLQLGGIWEGLEAGERDLGGGVLGVKGLSVSQTSCSWHLLLSIGNPKWWSQLHSPSFPMLLPVSSLQSALFLPMQVPHAGKVTILPPGRGRAGGGKAISKGFLSWLPPMCGTGRNTGCVDRCVWGRRESPGAHSHGASRHSASGLGRGSASPASSLLVLVVFVFPWSTRQSAKGIRYHWYCKPWHICR